MYLEILYKIILLYLEINVFRDIIVFRNKAPTRLGFVNFGKRIIIVSRNIYIL